jgi:hypothetical protein
MPSAARCLEAKSVVVPLTRILSRHFGQNGFSYHYMFSGQTSPRLEMESNGSLHLVRKFDH